MGTNNNVKWCEIRRWKYANLMMNPNRNFHSHSPAAAPLRSNSRRVVRIIFRNVNKKEWTRGRGKWHLLHSVLYTQIKCASIFDARCCGYFFSINCRHFSAFEIENEPDIFDILLEWIRIFILAGIENIRFLKISEIFNKFIGKCLMYNNSNNALLNW